MIKIRNFILEHNQNRSFLLVRQLYFPRLNRNLKKTRIDRSKLFISPRKINSLNFKHISFDLLTVFYTVVIHGSINTAAEYLSVSQPAISLSLQKIEKETGCLLFRLSKSTKSLILTSYGLLLFNYIQRLYQVIEECLNFSNFNISSQSLSQFNKTNNYKSTFFNTNKKSYLYSRVKLSIINIFLLKSKRNLLPLNKFHLQILENRSKSIFLRRENSNFENITIETYKNLPSSNFKIEKYKSLKNLNSQIFSSLNGENLIEVQTVKALGISIEMKISDLICWGSEI